MTADAHTVGRGRRVLVVEDEAMIAMLLEDMLDDLGCASVETTGRIEDARAAASAGDYDLAILDVDLNGTPSYPVADILRRRGIPLIFTTGYGAAGVSGDHAGTPVLSKPFRQDDLAALLSRLPPAA